MKIFFIVIVSCILFLVLASGVQAEEKKWLDVAELSYVDTSGNTDILSLSAKNVLTSKCTDKITGIWELSVLYGETNDIKTAERFGTEFRVEYLLSERLYAAGIAGLEKDEFAGIDSRYYLGPGVGYKLLTGPKHFLKGEAGLDFVMEEYTDGSDSDYLRGRAFGLYEYSFSEKNKFSQSLELLNDLDDSDNYNVISITAYITAVSDKLSLKTSYEIRYDNQPIPNTLDDTDTILSITLVANF